MRHWKPEIVKSFRDCGLRCTPQRYGVLECLRQCPTHPTADEIYRAMNRHDPRASRATVYNNLRSLIGAGLARELAVDGRAARFEAVAGKHHHFVCYRCGRVEDVDWFEVAGLARRGELAGRGVKEYELLMRGTCNQCQKEEL